MFHFSCFVCDHDLWHPPNSGQSRATSATLCNVSSPGIYNAGCNTRGLVATRVVFFCLMQGAWLAKWNRYTHGQEYNQYSQRSSGAYFISYGMYALGQGLHKNISDIYQRYIMIFWWENIVIFVIFMIFSACEEYFGFCKKRKCFDFEIQTGRRWFCRKEQMKRLLNW